VAQNGISVLSLKGGIVGMTIDLIAGAASVSRTHPPAVACTTDLLNAKTGR
jgi:hypothetical protein